MIRVKEERGLVGILNLTDSIFPQCLFYSNLSYFLLQKTDILGTSQVVNIIKELWTVLDEPIAPLCKEANLGWFTVVVSNSSSGVTSCQKQDVEERVEACEAVVHQLQEDFNGLVRNLAARHIGVFH